MDRAALASTLRSHRARVTPADVGLPAGRHRRVAGLRREEVAQLAGVSVDYISRLEQARGPVPSDLVLSSLARALRLTDDERDHLFRLAGSAPPLPHHIVSVPRAATLRLLERLGDLPALLVDAKGDLLAWNSVATALFGDFSAWPVGQRNLAWQQFLGSGHRRSTGGDEIDRVDEVDSEDPSDDAEHGSEIDRRVGATQEEADRLAAETVADLRMKAARYPDDPGLARLLEELRSRSSRFAALWDEGRAGSRRSSRKTVNHPELGPLSFDCDALHVPSVDQYLIVYSAAPGSPEAEALDLLRVVGLQEFATTNDGPAAHPR